MSDYEVKQVDEMEAVYLGAFKRARAELGVESFGMQIIDMPPEFENYPEHAHTHDNQEEVFLVMRGGGEIEIAGERFPLDDNHVARVAPEVRRKVWPGPEGIRLVVLGGVPGGPYQAPDISKLGEPDPMAAS
jgi:mannose-6-phosphate isomerase-like protein (cupin superfamily)